MGKSRAKLVIQVSLDVLLVVVSVFVIFWLAGKVYTFGYNIFDEQAVDTVENARVTEVTIPKNVTAEELADIMYDKGLTEDKTTFYLQVLLSDYKGKFKEGTYTLNTGMTPTEMMKIIASDTKGN